MPLAPIAFFAYKRPVHTERALTSLAACDLADRSQLFIFCDGPRSAEDRPVVEQVAKVARSKPWCGRVEIIESSKNIGCADSIIKGITQICDQFGRVIVIEDDLVLSPHFLEYINTALARYSTEKNVMQICAHMFPVELAARTDAVFLPFVGSWGWATWKRAWDLFDPGASAYETLRKNQALRRQFDLDGSMGYFRMLEHQLAGIIDAWDIRWYLSVFMHDGLTLYPKMTLVRNCGFDSSGMHCQEGSGTIIAPPDQPFAPFKIVNFPEAEIDQDSLARLIGFFRSLRVPLYRRIYNRLNRMISKSRNLPVDRKEVDNG